MVRRALLVPTVTLTTLIAACTASYQMSPEPASGRSCPRGPTGLAGGQAGGVAADSAGAAVIWYYPEEKGDNRHLEAWCITVGPPVLRLVPGAGFGPLLPGDSLTVAVWNSNVGAGQVVEFLTEELSLRCSGPGSALEPGASHFVLLMQEAFRRSPDIPPDPPGGAMPPPVAEEPSPGPRTDTMEIAERCGLSLAYVAAARNGREERDGLREDKGVAILSTLPLSDVIGIELPFEAARRVTLAATVRDANGDSLRLVNVHFISTVGPARALTTGNDSRPRQALAVVDALREVEAARAAGDADSAFTTSTLLAGDLNTWSETETAILLLREHFPDSPPPLGEATRGPFPTDHLLFRRSASPGSPWLVEDSYERIEQVYNSDHHGVVARVVFAD